MSARQNPSVFQLEKEPCRQAAILIGIIMKKNTALKIVNLILLVLVINQLMTGFFSMKLSHDAFVLLHKRGAIVLAGFIIVHIILNFNWIKANYFHK